MPQPSIARIEAGTVIPRTATLIALLHATGHQLSVVPIDPAVDREDDLYPTR
jgi:predicted transcriptional regulator